MQADLRAIPKEEQRELLRELLEVRRLTLAAAAEMLGITRKRVWDLAVRYGIDRRKQRAKHHRDEIYQMKLDGHSMREIASRFSCAIRTVQSICKDYERHLVNHELGIPDEGPFTRCVWGSDLDDEAEELQESFTVQPWRCPKHGLVKIRPCVQCQAEAEKEKRGFRF